MIPVVFASLVFLVAPQRVRGNPKEIPQSYPNCTLSEMTVNKMAKNGNEKPQTVRTINEKIESETPNTGSRMLMFEDEPKVPREKKKSDNVPPRKRGPKVPLVLTPYVRTANFAEGVQKARIKNPRFSGMAVSNSGLFEVRNDSYMFFWHILPMNNNSESAPVIVWIHGGTGESCMRAAFWENGPIRLKPRGKLVPNNWTWAAEAHMVYFDSPVGVGYSYTKSGKYSTNQDEVTEDLLSALDQFVQLFGLSNNNLFIAGQGYAGKTVVALGGKIHARMDTDLRINLQGFAIGNGFIDPPNMMGYAKLLYTLGFADDKEREELKRFRENIQKLMETDMKKALDEYAFYVHDITGKRQSYIEKLMQVPLTKYTKMETGPDEKQWIERYHNLSPIRNTFHVNGIQFVESRPEVVSAIRNDLLSSYRDILQVLMKNYRVLLYNAQLSILHAYPLVQEYVAKTRWWEAAKYRTTVRARWEMNGDLVGYGRTAKTADDVSEVTDILVLNSGLAVSADQPEVALALIMPLIFHEPST